MTLVLLLFFSSTAFAQLNTKVFADENGFVSIELPANWHLLHEGGGKTSQMFVSVQKITKEKSFFETGVSTTYINNFADFTSHSDDQIVSIINQVGKDLHTKHKEYIELENRPFKLGKYRGVYTLVKFLPFNSDEWTKMVMISLISDVNYVSVVLESSKEHWENYEFIFEQAIKTIKIKD